jgi:phosphoglycolate phosphatase-like HAD superfamily hydrolase
MAAVLEIPVPLRIGFDLDGVLADLASAYLEVDRRLFGAETAAGGEVPASAGELEEVPDDAEKRKRNTSVRETAARLRENLQRRRSIWHAIGTTEDFWTTLQPLEEGLVARLAAAAAQHQWEVFFVTQRPETAGETAQRQTQRWLAAQGFELPSVVVTRGSRGRLADALGLDYLVDDTPKNCVDVVTDSTTRVILVDRSGDPSVADNARALNVAVVATASEALDLLERAMAVRSSPTLLGRLAKMVGWA